MDVTVYTDAMLDNNFKVIAQSFDIVGNGFQTLDAHIHHLEGHVVDLTRQVARLTAKAPKKHSVLSYAVAFGFGIYVYKKAKTNLKKIDVIIDNVNEGAKKRFTPPTTVEGDIATPSHTDDI